MPQLQYVEQIYDNIHGYIPLTAVEYEVLRAPIFQRLRHVKQLGLANLVFPGAEHSRFAHSLGVMHIVDRLTSALDPLLEPPQQQLVRLGALLHDIGHFPLSHALEEVLADLLEKQQHEQNREWVRDLIGEAEPQPSPHAANTKLHEFLGQTIIQKTQVGEILDAHDINPLQVAAIAMGKTAELEGEVPDAVLGVLSQMLHSQIDADRIDYLLRDSNFSGVESGGFDLPKLYKEVCWGEGRYGFRVSGLRAVEQFLMARLTNYRRVAFNKHVQSFEEMAKAIYRKLAEAGKLPDFQGVQEMVDGRSLGWIRFNDHYLMDRFFKYVDENGADPWAAKRALLLITGQPMVEVAIEERFCTKAEWQDFKEHNTRIPRNEEERVMLAARAGVDPEEITVVDSSVAVIKQDPSDRVYIHDGSAFVDILGVPESLMKAFSDRGVYLRRLYCLDEAAAERVRGVI